MDITNIDMANRTIKDRGRSKPVLTKAGFTKTRRRLRNGGKCHG